MSDKIKQFKTTILAGYPLQVYSFTGRTIVDSTGYYKAKRNRIKLIVPEYRADDGHCIYDMTQAYRERAE